MRVCTREEGGRVQSAVADAKHLLLELDDLAREVLPVAPRAAAAKPSRVEQAAAAAHAHAPRAKAADGSDLQVKQDAKDDGRR